MKHYLRGTAKKPQSKYLRGERQHGGKLLEAEIIWKGAQRSVLVLRTGKKLDQVQKGLYSQKGKGGGGLERRGDVRYRTQLQGGGKLFHLIPETLESNGPAVRKNGFVIIPSFPPLEKQVLMKTTTSKGNGYATC